MSRDEYEIYLLEIRQALKDEESSLKSRNCTSLTKFKSLVKLKIEIREALIKYRIGYKEKDGAVIKLMEG